MARNYYVNGETMIAVKGRSDCGIAALTNLGLCEDAIRIRVEYNHDNIKVDAYGNVPPDLQAFGTMATVSMTLIHFDFDVLMECVKLSMGGAPAEGQLGHAGALMGNGLARFAPGGANGNHFIGLNIISAAGKQPWRFFYASLADNPLDFPLGTRRSSVVVNWKALPYSQDPWNNGNGSFGVPIFDHTLDA